MTCTLHCTSLLFLVVFCDLWQVKLAILAINNNKESWRRAAGIQCLGGD